MRGSVATSFVLHCVVLVCALVTIGAPRTLDTPESEAMPVDLVAADQLQQGEKTAPVKDHAAKKQTTKQTQVANAQNTGENDIDLKNPATPKARPTDDNAAAAVQKKVQTPVPKDDPQPNDVKTIEQQETDAAPKEVAAIPQQRPDVTPPTPTPPPTPKADSTPPTPTPPTPPKADTPPPPPTQQPAEITVPDNIPLPEVKPQAQPPKTADKTPDVKPDPKPEVKPETKPAPVKPETKPTDKTVTQSTNKSPDDGKKNDDKKRETAKGSTAQDSDFNADEISKLLNKNSSAGGAARSKQEASAGANTQVASLGGKKSAGGGKLSQSEMDGLKDLIQGNWNVQQGLEGASEVRVKIVVQLDRSGNVVGDPQITATGGTAGTQDAIKGSAYRAVMRSAPFKPDLLPADKYDGDNGWNQLVLNFDASDLGL
ncbi:hypothetical protein DTW90_04450 [Neorhizobium sp. P12A]|jgi:hypothetical protein|uniref:hypothetical protein n=1 Tax=Neorhizobium sp. P12A TaxID=2268027 RepID=UPI0011F093C1|nr:hypothetical protein [Neorhizobium sp. P12A]KAA0700877.1 hypothetical protein DTW90_04450 [Neorhizobium sp. P12A]